MFEEIIRERLASLNIPAEIDAHKYETMLEAFEDIVSRYADSPAFSCLGCTITYRQLDEYASALAAYFQQELDLQEGDRIAIQLPNILQFPVATFAALKAGLVVVNTNPLYTEPELEHQFNDAGVKALIVLANVADTAAKVVAHTSIESVIVTELADLHPVPKRQLLNFAVKYIKGMVPKFDIPGAKKFTDAIKFGKGKSFERSSAKYDDLAVLQYTGGTTGVAKGAMLSHGNILSNTLQCTPIFDTYGLKEKETLVQPLPLYHVFAAVVGYIVMFKGGHTILIPNPRDLPATIKEMKKWKFSAFCGLNTLFVALNNHPDFPSIDFSHLKLTLSGGMALTEFAAQKWQSITGNEIHEGYGLTETSPVVSVNPGGFNMIGSIGVPVPNTRIKIVDDEGNKVGINERGELCVKGPQLMKGYWNREDETNKAIVDGWFYTGDIALMSDEGRLKIVDRKKDMILVSGFNVYPGEVEDAASNHEGVLEAAAIGLPNNTSGEVVCLYAVKSDASLTEKQLIDFCRESLAAYKVPHKIVFVPDLPKSNVGKVLRRKVKEMALAAREK